MSKKNFTDGLESIFTDSSEKVIQDGQAFLSYDTKSSRDPGEIFAAENRSSSHHDTDDEQEVVPNTDKKPLAKLAIVQKLHKKPLTGLDLLIRNTTQDTQEYPGVNQHRIAFVFDKSLLGKLKAIARLEKKYFRDLVSDLLKVFVENYEKDKGPIHPES